MIIMPEKYVAKKVTEGDTQRNNLVVSFVKYLEAKMYMQEATDLIESFVDLELRMPKLELYKAEELSAAAKMYNGTLIIYGYNNINKEVISHEMYHYAQNIYRGDNYKIESGEDSETRFLLNNRATPQKLDRASKLWDMANEAGAYLFGLYSGLHTHLNNTDTAKQVIVAFEKMYTVKIGSFINEALNYIYDSNASIEDYFKIREGHLVPSRPYGAMLITLIILNENKMDFIKSFRDLIIDPERILERINKLGIGNVKKLLDEFLV